MSGSYIPYGGNPTQYGQGPGHLFFPPSWGMPAATLDNPRTLSLPTASPLENTTEGALATLMNPDGDPNGLPSESIAHPNPSLGALFGSLATAVGLMTPMGAMMAGPALAARDALGMEPGFGMAGVLGELASRGLANLTSRDMTAMGLDNAPPGTGAQVGGWGLASGDGKGGAPDGGSKDGVDVGLDPGGPTADPGKGEPGPDQGDKGDYAGGGLIDLAGGGKVAMGIGGGLDDLIPTTINGRRAANLSDGEFVVPADVVSMMGDGSSAAGSRRLYDMMKAIRQHKTGSGAQAGPLQIGDTLRRIFK